MLGPGAIEGRVSHLTRTGKVGTKEKEDIEERFCIMDGTMG
jgi:hypothetical protein